jgi:flavin reductase (DIM6/NTAB) family NADH-FMN oxidoreductase RutF
MRMVRTTRHRCPQHFGSAGGISGLTPVPSETLEAPRVRECPVQLEAKVEGLHHLAEHDTAQRGRFLVIEVRIQRVHLEESILI